MKTPLPTRFIAHEYRDFRPDYPIELFQELKRRLKSLRLPDPTSLLDLGCGAGQSAYGFLAAFPPLESITLVDSNLEMLEECKKIFQSSSKSLEYIESKAENLDSLGKTFDAVSIGSAFHWMDAEALAENVKQFLHPKSFIFVFEYQFPRSIENLALNDWVKRRFNTEWKAPHQRPRGSFRDLLKPLEAKFQAVHFQAPPWRMKLDLKTFGSQIFSQSRYLHSEANLREDHEIQKRRDSILSEIAALWGNEALLDFNFYLDAEVFISRT